MALAGETFDLAIGFVLGDILEADPHNLVRRDKRDCKPANDPSEVPALVGDGAPEEDVEP
jgi:hypothetical protein